MPQFDATPAPTACKKRASLDLPAQPSQAQDALNKKLRRNSCDGSAAKAKQQQQQPQAVPPVMSAGMTAGMVNNLQLSQSAAWNYPSTFPMGMMPHMPMCFPSPFFNPFMFSNMWMPGMAGCAMPPGSMAPGMMPPTMHMGQGAAMMPAASASMLQAAFSTGMPAALPMYPGMQSAVSMPLPAAQGAVAMCVPMACPPVATTTATTSNASSCNNTLPFPSQQNSPTSNTIVMPKAAAPCVSSASACSVQMLAGSPPPTSSSPMSVANNSVGSSQDTNDQEFASFIDSFLNASNENFSEAFAESFNLHSPDITSSGDFTDFALPASTFDICCTSELEQPLGLKLSRSDSLMNLLDCQDFTTGEACAAC